MTPVEWARLVYVRLGWQMRPCGDCVLLGQPCAEAQRTMLLVDAASLAYDLAVAVEVEERLRASVAYA